MSWDSSFLAAQSDVQDLIKLSIEDLMKMEITSVSKKAQKISDAAAAVFVITQEDIRRSGVTTIPEALRMAPGVEVARIDANKWAISARGFNSRFANKLLVLIDGRSVYSSLFSGVWWDVQDTLIEDIDRIEVIRGPGATLWGANAVNGVINIITKKAKETRGGLVAVGGGTEERGFGAVRYGLKLAKDTDLRVYAKYFNRDSSVTSDGVDAADDWDSYRTGFRLDYDQSEKNSFTLQGDYYQGKIGSTYDVDSIIPPYDVTFQKKEKVSGVNIMGAWKHTFSNATEFDLRAYYDRAEQKDIMVAGYTDTVDLDFQYRLKGSRAHEIVRRAAPIICTALSSRMILPSSRIVCTGSSALNSSTIATLVLKFNPVRA
jgi:iron complex outermembrane receptor protein